MVLYFLGLELQTVVGHLVDAEDQSQVLEEKLVF